MTQPIPVHSIWWRNVQPGEFYNIERNPATTGPETGRGQQHIEVPTSLVPELLEFLDQSSQKDSVENLVPISITAKVIGDPQVEAQLTFQKSSGGRMMISNQNRQSPSFPRHPAWTAERGFPKAPDDVATLEHAKQYMPEPESGLRIYIAKTTAGEYYAGFTKGRRPADMATDDPMWNLFPEGRTPPGGMIYG